MTEVGRREAKHAVLSGLQRVQNPITERWTQDLWACEPRTVWAGSGALDTSAPVPGPLFTPL